MLLLPWHLSDYLSDGLNVSVPPDVMLVEGQPGQAGQPWADLAGVYAGLKDAVAAAPGVPVVLTGDCVASLAVLAGLQARGLQPGLVWFDAHGDFHTEDTTLSGYLGGLPLAKAVGRGDLTLPDAVGMTPLPEESALLVDGRDLDPPEAEELAASAVRQVSVASVAAGAAVGLPAGPLLLHVDLDIIDSAEVAGLRFPAPGGPSVSEVAAAIAAVARVRDIAALDVAATWRPAEARREQTDAALRAVLAAAGFDGSIAADAGG